MDTRNAAFVGNIGPVPLYVDITAFFLVVLAFWGDAPLSVKIIFFAVLVLSIVLHELGHAVATLIKSSDGVVIMLTGLGGVCSHSPTMNPKDSMFISMSGPAVNFLLVLIAWLVLDFVVPTLSSDFLSSDLGIVFYQFMAMLFNVNLFLGIFNSLPIYPMDGGQTLYAGVEWRGCSQYKCRKVTWITSVAAAAVGIALYTLITGHMIDTFLALLVLLLLYKAYEDLAK